MVDSTYSHSPISPVTVLELVSNAGLKKAELPFSRLLVLSILAGVYIAFGGILFTIVGVGLQGAVPYGIGKLIQGLAFCLGLILVVVGSAELFTGNMLMVIPLLEKKISWLRLLRNWGIVYLGNFIGSILMAILIILGKVYITSNGQLGDLMVAIAQKKLTYGFGQAVVLGIFCNMLVCLAVWMTYSAKSTTDKILAVIFPITAFIAAGFEHSVANMYLIPAGLLLKWMDPVFTSNIDLSGLTFINLIFRNLIPVTLGNIIGGSGIVGVAYFLSYRKSR